LTIDQLWIPRRDRLSIIAEMLRTAKEEANKAKIMRCANLSSLQFEYYIDVMLRSRLVESDLKKERSCYRITEKGLSFLRVHGEAMSLFVAPESELVISARVLK